MDYLEVTLRSMVATVFLVAVAGKLRGPAAFRAFIDSLRDTDLVPSTAVRLIGGTVVVAESAIVVSMLAHGSAALGFLLAATLLTVFVTGIHRVVRRGTSASCACFGTPTSALGYPHLVRNAALSTAAVLGGIATSMNDHAGLPFGVIATGVPAGLVLALIAIRFEDLTELFPAPASTGRDR